MTETWIPYLLAERYAGRQDEWHVDFPRDFCNCKWDRKIAVFRL